MNELFRFVSVRPPHATDGKKAIDGDKLTEKSAFGKALGEAKGKNERRQLALQFKSSGRFVSDPAAIKPQLARLVAFIAGLDDKREVDLARVVQDQAGAARAAIVGSGDFAAAQQQLAETLLALRETGEASSALGRAIRDLLAAFRLLEQDAFFAGPVKAKDLRKFLAGVVVAFAPATAGGEAKARRGGEKAARAESKQGSEDNRPDRLTELKQLRATLTDLQAELDTIREAERAFDDAPVADDKEMAALRQRHIENQRTAEARVAAPLAKLRPQAEALLAPSGLALDVDTVAEAISLVDEKIALLSKTGGSAGENTRYVYYRGGLLARRANGKKKGPKLFEDQEAPGGAVRASSSPQVAPLAVPQGVGYAHVLGIGDLMVVREETKRYAAGEVAHIENVLAGEYKDRSHRRTVKTEESVFTESERETETERDLQSTERFQLSQEASEIQSMDSKLEAGFNLSASYGPTVSVGANTSAALTASSESSAKSASSYSHDVTERARNRVVERTREQRSRTETLEIEEINKHGFDNKGKNTHVVGVYRWVDKVVRARLMNYGQRMMLEFVVPEPAAMFVQALFDAPPQGLNVEKPDEKITALSAADIANDADDAHDYRKLASLYQVTDIEPPPPRYTKLADNITFADSKDAASQSTSKKIAITDGYRAYKVVMTRSRSTSGSGITLHVAVASGSGELTGHKREFTPSHMLGELPISVSYTGNRAVSVHATVYCERTDELLSKWRIKTYKALIEGYQKMQTRYDEQLAVASLDRSVRAGEFSPDRNRAIERAEIKRSVISILTGQHFDAFGAIITDGDAPARIDFSEAIAEGKYIQFFENAFEWSNMSYIMYPYFWGRQTTWFEKLGLDGADPNHLAFLQAGAARVVVPVRPDYEPVLIHYLDTGEIWNGEDVPDLSSVSAPYVDITTEIREQQGNPITAPVLVEEWEVKLPTSLVILQADASLPEFALED